MEPGLFSSAFELARVLGHPTATEITIAITATTREVSQKWSRGWQNVAWQVEQAPVRCATLSLVVPEHIFAGNRAALVEAARMLRERGVTLKRCLERILHGKRADVETAIDDDPE